MPAFFAYLASYAIARLGEASTYAGAAVLINAVAQHQGPAAIAQAAGGLAAILLPATVTGPIKAIAGGIAGAK